MPAICHDAMRDFDYADDARAATFAIISMLRYAIIFAIDAIFVTCC